MEKNRITLSQAIEGYFIAAQARRLSPHTLHDNDNTFHKFQQFLVQDPVLAAITAADIRAFINHCQGLSAKTLLNYHTGLSALWTWALKEEIVPRQIVRDVQPPKPDKRDIIPFDEHEVKAMLTACDRSRAYTRPGKRKCDNQRPTALRDRAIIFLLVDTGLRASELCNLAVRDADHRNHRVVIGKGRKERHIPLSPRTEQAIWRYLTTRGETKPAEPLFATSVGRPLDRTILCRLIHTTGERAGVSGAHPHRFRHTFAITFLRNGGNVFALQTILGHESLDMVKRYLMIAQTDLQKAHQDASPVMNWLL